MKVPPRPEMKRVANRVRKRENLPGIVCVAFPFSTPPCFAMHVILASEYELPMSFKVRVLVTTLPFVSEDIPSEIL